MVDKLGSMFAFVAGAVATVAMVGCAAPTEAPPTSAGEQHLVLAYDGVTVVSDQAVDGSIRVEPKNANGEATMALVVRGDRIAIEPLADRSLAPWSGMIPADARTSQLEDWSYIAYAYSQHVEAPKPATREPFGVKPQMQRAGTDGQMCIAAGGTAMECAYWLYCSKHWCPFW